MLKLLRKCRERRNLMIASDIAEMRWLGTQFHFILFLFHYFASVHHIRTASFDIICPEMWQSPVRWTVGRQKSSTRHGNMLTSRLLSFQPVLFSLRSVSYRRHSPLHQITNSPVRISAEVPHGVGRTDIACILHGNLRLLRSVLLWVACRGQRLRQQGLRLKRQTQHWGSNGCTTLFYHSSRCANEDWLIYLSHPSGLSFDSQ